MIGSITIRQSLGSNLGLTFGRTFAIYGVLLNLLVFAVHSPAMAARGLDPAAGLAGYALCLDNPADGIAGQHEDGMPPGACPVCAALGCVHALAAPPALPGPPSAGARLLPHDLPETASGPARDIPRNRGPPAA